MAARLDGKQGHKSDKEWRDAIRLAVHGKREGVGGSGKALRLLAERLVTEALDGNITAMKEIGDRLDGRAVQPIAGADGEGPLVIQVLKLTDADYPAAE